MCIDCEILLKKVKKNYNKKEFQQQLKPIAYIHTSKTCFVKLIFTEWNS